MNEISVEIKIDIALFKLQNYFYSEVMKGSYTIEIDEVNDKIFTLFIGKYPFLFKKGIDGKIEQFPNAIELPTYQEDLKTLLKEAYNQAIEDLQ